MSNAENTIFKDVNTELSSPDEPMGTFDGKQNIKSDIDELQQLLSDVLTDVNDSNAIINTENTTSSADDRQELSALEELEELYGGTVEMEADDIEAAIEVVEPINQDASDGDSLMQGLEELFGSSAEPIDIGPTSKSIEQISIEEASIEEDSIVVSALDELRVFLDDSTQTEVRGGETPSMVTQEVPPVCRKSLFDELQSLLDACINELKGDVKGTLDNISVSTDIEHLNKYELQNLLETTLSQIQSISEDSLTTASVGSVSVLDELRDLMHETGVTESTEAATLLDPLFVDDDLEELGKDEVDDVVSGSDVMAAADTGSDSILDELKLLLGDSSNEIFDASLPSDNLKSAIPSENSVLEELATYMAELSDDTSNAAEVSEDKMARETAGMELSSASNTLDELEVMLSELCISAHDENNDDVKESEENFPYDNEARCTSADSGKHKVEDNSALYQKEQSIEGMTDKVEADKEIAEVFVKDVNLFNEQGNNSRVPITGLLFSAVLSVAIYGFWSLLSTGEATDVTLEKSHAALVDKSAMVFEKPKQSWQVNSVTQEPESSYGAVSEESEAVPVEADSIYDLLAKTGVSGYVAMGNYQDELLNIENSEAGIDNKVTQNTYDESIAIKTEDEVKEIISYQVNGLQKKNRESIRQLNDRLVEAEVSIALLEVEKKLLNIKKSNIQSDKTAPSVTPEKPGSSVKHALIKQPVQKVSVSNKQDKAGRLWAVYLSSYYGKPPPAGELEYLGDAGISYKIKKTKVKGEIWYRVVVNEFSEYDKAKEYSDDISKSVGRNDIWINKSQ